MFEAQTTSFCSNCFLKALAEATLAMEARNLLSPRALHVPTKDGFQSLGVCEEGQSYLHAHPEGWSIP